MRDPNVILVGVVVYAFAAFATIYGIGQLALASIEIYEIITEVKAR